MRKNKDKEDKQNVLIFDYENFVNKSSQQRYYELKNEVKNKLDKISDEINIAGSNEEEKKYNLLMHYKFMLESFDSSAKERKFIIDTVSSFIKDVVVVLTVGFPLMLSYMVDEKKLFSLGLTILIFLAMILMVGFLYVSHARDNKKIIKQDSQEYLYYEFYYSELKKHIKEDE